jgi:hypothetical protein
MDDESQPVGGMCHDLPMADVVLYKRKEGRQGVMMRKKATVDGRPKSLLRE